MTNPERSFEVRTVEDGEPGSFEGYASVFGVVDSHGTVFDRGAFTKTIKERGGWLPIVWMHKPDVPIGRALVTEDDIGMRVQGQLDLDVQKGAEVHSGMKKGYITVMSHSFGKIPDKIKIVKTDGVDVPHFREVKSFEVSPVTANFASASEATIDMTSVRTEAPQEPMVIPDGMRTQMDRIDALLEPSNDTRTEPQGKPGIHLQGIQTQVERISRLRSD